MIKNGKHYDDEIEISMNGNTHKIPLSDYLDIQAHQLGFKDYDDLYKSSTRIKGYEDISPVDLENYQEELKQKDLRELKDKLSEYNINIKSFNSYYVKNGISIYCGELDDGRYFINDLNENIYLTNNNFNDYFNSQTKEIDFSKMATEDEPNDELSKLFIDYLLVAKSDFKADSKPKNIDLSVNQNSLKDASNRLNQPNFKLPDDYNLYSKNHKEFINYCKDKVISLEPTEDIFGKKYLTLMKCTIENKPSSIVYLKNYENKLCWIDSNKTIQMETNDPNIFACDMKFEQIDKGFFEVINKYWDKLGLDEIIDINKSVQNEYQELYEKHKS